MPTALTPELQQFVQSQIASGKYASAEEVLIAGLKLLEERERIYQGRFEELRQTISVGIAEADRGEFIDAETVFQTLRNKLEQHRAQIEQ